MFGIGLSQLLIVLVLALVLIGPKQLPEVAKAIAKLLVELRRASNMLSDEFRNSMGEDDYRRTIQPPPPMQSPYDQGQHQASSAAPTADQSAAHGHSAPQETQPANPTTETASGATPNPEEKKS